MCCVWLIYLFICLPCLWHERVEGRSPAVLHKLTITWKRIFKLHIWQNSNSQLWVLKIPSIEWLCGHKTPQHYLSSEQGLAVKQRIYCKYKLMSIIIQIKSFLKARICCVSQKKNGCILSFLSSAVSHASQNLGLFTSWILKGTNIMFSFLFYVNPVF